LVQGYLVKRRVFISGLGSTVTWPLAAHAQTAAKTFRVGFVLARFPQAQMAGPEPISLITRLFLKAMREAGYNEGQNLIFERRSAEGQYDRFPEIFTELVARKVDVIITVSNDATAVAKRITNTIPIVMASSQDPVGNGLVASLARPGGNVTGITVHTGAEIDAKRLQLLTEAVPKAKRIACLSTQPQWDSHAGEQVREAAKTLGLNIIHAAHTTTDYANAFQLILREKAEALLVPQDSSVVPNRQLIAAFAIKNSLPGIFPIREVVEEGGLMSYGVNNLAQMRRAATLVDKVLKGAKPEDLPVEQPTKFEMLLNLRAAKTLGLTMPTSILLRADEVIE
jgi:putative tryptophan/tyrosine transport system substrate-binding protein